jgi:septum formation protein
MSAASHFVYLASQSPRRRQLLEQIEVRHELLLPAPEEEAEKLEAEWPGELPQDYVVRVTGLKLAAAQTRWALRALPPAPVLCADTTVALDGAILGKPRDAQHACRMLAALSGSEHEVLTAVALAWPAQGQWQRAAALSRSRVRFASLSQAEIERYVASGEPMGKAGAYAVQGLASRYIVQIHGSYSGIMGLPLYETASLLSQVASGEVV